MMTSASIRKWLRLLLFAVGGILIVAIIPIFFPASLMATIHGWLGLGDFPDRPIVLYLARSTSLLYVAHGLFIVFIARNIERHWDLVPLVGGLHIFMGAILLGTDVTAGMPWYWTAGEGGPIMAAGFLILWMWKKAGTPQPAAPN